MITMSEDDFMDHCDSYDGLCRSCGEITWGGTEPDAEGYPCEECGEDEVIGMENALIEGLVEFE